MQCNDNYSWMSHTCALSVLVFCYFTATADPFPLGVRAAATAAPLYVQASIRVGALPIRVGVRPSATADQIVPWYRISARREGGAITTGAPLRSFSGISAL